MKKKIVQVGLTILFSLLVFLGAGLSVTYFNSDVNMQDALKKIFQLFSAGETSANLMLSCYSTGIGLGMLLYYYCQYTLKK